jgi:hypothetical protein
MWHAWERREECTSLWWETPKERYHSDDRDVDERMGSDWNLDRSDVGGGWWSGLCWFRIGTGGGLLLTR